ncbi:unnamed protein product [Peniophora sp. CBMAI 1063]|nr:unnamed protein product [Peniophora sp. CBMAI 1063]
MDSEDETESSITASSSKSSPRRDTDKTPTAHRVPPPRSQSESPTPQRRRVVSTQQQPLIDFFTRLAKSRPNSPAPPPPPAPTPVPSTPPAVTRAPIAVQAPAPTPADALPFAPRARRVPMAMPAKFNGSGDNPEDFLRSFEGWCFSCEQRADDEKAEAFPLCLKSGSPADIWYKAQPAVTRGSFRALRAAFLTRFPAPEVAARSPEDAEEELEKLELPLDLLGKKISEDGVDVWSHVKYANTAKALALEANILSTTTNLTTLRRKLPAPLVNLLNYTQHTTLEQFFADIKRVNTQKLTRAAEEARSNEQRARKNDQKLAALENQLAALRMSQRSQSQPQYPTQAANSRPPSNAYARQPATFPMGQTQAPIFRRQASAPSTGSASAGAVPVAELPMPTAAQRAVLAALINVPVPNDTPQNMATYTNAFRQATAQLRGPRDLTWDTPIPFRPGTAAPCSAECYRCGTHGHRGQGCQIPNGTDLRLPGYESRWRAMLNRAFPDANKGRTIEIHLVESWVLSRTVAGREDVDVFPGPTECDPSCVPQHVLAVDNEVFDLYSVDENIVKKEPDALPFVQTVGLVSATGEISRVRGLFDDGARISILSSAVFDIVKHRLTEWSTSFRTLRMANGELVPSRANWHGTIEIGGVRTTGEFEVFDSKGSWSFLVGKPLLRAFRAIHDYTPDTVLITGDDGRSVTLHNKLLEGAHRTSDDLQTLVVDWKEGRPHSIRLVQEDSAQSATDVASPVSRTTVTAPSMLQRPQPLDVSTNVFAVSESGIYTRRSAPHNPARVAAILQAVTIGSDLTPEQHARAEQLIADHADCFALNVTEVLPAKDAVHRLHIPEGTTFSTKVRQQSMNPPKRQYMAKTIDDLLAADVIERVDPSQVKCVSPVTLAQKAHDGVGLSIEELQDLVNEQCVANGMEPYFDERGAVEFREARRSNTTTPSGERKWRMCINYDELNKATQVPPMPQGDIRAKQQRLSGQRYVSTWDFASGFYAVEIAEESRPYTAFYVEGRGFFWFKRMPFGLTGAPTTFADVTARHMHDLIEAGIMELFVDDGGACGDDFDTMLGKLEQVLQRVRERHLSLSAPKFFCFMRNSKFSGARVGRDGVLPDLAKLTAIVEWPVPATAFNLASFLGLTGHFRDLIRDYARIEGPLRDLLAMVDLPVPYTESIYKRVMTAHLLAPHWTDKHTEAFLRLKGILTSEPVLRAPRWDGTPFIVTTDGCKEGFAGVLTQRHATTLANGKVVTRLHPIAFASKRTSRSEAKYPPFLLELAALKFTLDKFSDIIWGFPIELETDCQALRDVIRSKKLNAHYARWRDGVLAYRIVDVRHIPGKINLVADGMSRQFENQPRIAGDGSEWDVCEDWESATGLAFDVFRVEDSPPEPLPVREPQLRDRFKDDWFFLDVVDAILSQQHLSTSNPREKARARHRASQYFLEDGKLWRLRGSTAVRARSKVECVTRAEARELAAMQHADGGHWGRDAVKMALLDRIVCPKLDDIILEAIQDCPQCKAFGPAHLNSLLDPITRRTPFELLVGDYLTLPVGKGGHKTLGVYVDVFSQHVYVDKFRVAGSGTTTNKTLKRIFDTYQPYGTFMTDGGSHFDNERVREFCASRGCRAKVIAAYSPWINGLCENTNKLLLHVLKHLCAPALGEDDYVEGSWDELPTKWPDYLDEAVNILNNRILPRIGFTPRELLLGLVVNAKSSPNSSEASVAPSADEIAMHQAYAEQQRFDASDAVLRNALRRKAEFDRRVERDGGARSFHRGQLVQYRRNDLEFTLSADRKLLAFWSEPYRVRECAPNSYTLEDRAGTVLKGRFSARRLREFTPRAGTKLASEQTKFMQALKEKDGADATDVGVGRTAQARAGGEREDGNREGDEEHTDESEGEHDWEALREVERRLTMGGDGNDDDDAGGAEDEGEARESGTNGDDGTAPWEGRLRKRKRVS